MEMELKKEKEHGLGPVQGLQAGSSSPPQKRRCLQGHSCPQNTMCHLTTGLSIRQAASAASSSMLLAHAPGAQHSCTDAG